MQGVDVAYYLIHGMGGSGEDFQKKDRLAAEGFAQAALEQAVDLPLEENSIFEIGSQDVVNYGALIRMYAQERNWSRLLIRVPLLTPYLSSLWLGIFTPSSAEIGRYLIEGLKNPTIVRNDRAQQGVPAPSDDGPRSDPPGRAGRSSASKPAKTTRVVPRALSLEEAT